jgi:RimJ/RimL family protein N-acetyltransferase
MIELNMNQWHLARPLITEDIPFVVISMHFQRHRFGRVWIDSLFSPKTVVAAFTKDFYACGEVNNPTAIDVLRGLTGSTPQTSGLRTALQEAWGSFAFTPSILHEYRGGDPTFSPPSGYRVEPIAVENLPQVLSFWEGEFEEGTIGDFLSVREFLAESFGHCVIHVESRQCVAACAAISVSKERCDFGLDTSPQHEGLGLATACSQAAVQEALRRGKRPVWVTDWNNLASQRVAAKIGFVKTSEFEIYRRLHVIS